MTFLNAKTAFVAFAALTGSFFAMADTAAAQDCRNMKVQGETATYCPYMIREARVDAALNAGCVRVAFDGIVARELYCPVDLMMGQGTVVAQVAPAQIGTQGNNQTGGGTRPDTGAGNDTDGTPGTGGSTGGNTGGGTPGGNGGSTNGGTTGGTNGGSTNGGSNGGSTNGGAQGNGGGNQTAGGTSSSQGSSAGASGGSTGGTAGGSSSNSGSTGGTAGGTAGGSSSNSGAAGGVSTGGGVAGGSSGSWNG